MTIADIMLSMSPLDLVFLQSSLHAGQQPHCHMEILQLTAALTKRAASGGSSLSATTADAKRTGQVQAADLQTE